MIIDNENILTGSSLKVKLYLIDNYKTNRLISLCDDHKIEYLHDPSNSGLALQYK